MSARHSQLLRLLKVPECCFHILFQQFNGTQNNMFFEQLRYLALVFHQQVRLSEETCGLGFIQEFVQVLDQVNSANPQACIDIYPEHVQNSPISAFLVVVLIHQLVILQIVSSLCCQVTRDIGVFNDPLAYNGVCYLFVLKIVEYSFGNKDL